MKALRVAGQDLGWLLGLLGVSTSALKVLLPLERARSGRSACGNSPHVLVLLTLCLFYSWGAAMFAALQISAVRELPLHLVLFLSAAWALVEIGGSLLPVVAWVAIRGQRHRPRAFSRGASTAATKPCIPFARDVAELVQRIRQDGKIPPHLVGINLAPDGTILTSQSALAKALGQSKATVHRRLHALSASGAITLATSGSCTRIGVGAYATALAA